MKPRFLASGRALLVCACLVALLVSPAAAQPPARPVAAPPAGCAAAAPPAPVAKHPAQSDPVPPGNREFLPLAMAPGPLPTSFELIDDALAKGTLDSETALVYKVFALFGDARLPRQFKGSEARVAGGTELMAEMVDRYPTLSSANQAILAPFWLPPYYQGSWEDQLSPQAASAAQSFSPAGGDGALAVAPAGTPPPAGPPHAELSAKWYWKGDDKVKVWGRRDIPDDDRRMDVILAAVKDAVWPTETALMGRVPISDAGIDDNGGDGHFDIALSGMRDFGVTITYSSVWKGPTHLRISRTLSDTDLRGTVAHEFMHAIQHTYGLHAPYNEYSWLFEATATWAEDCVFPQQNTEQLYLSAFLDHPHTSLEDVEGTHEYGAYLLPFYLSHRYSPDLIRQITEATQNSLSLPAIDSVVAGGLKEQWPDFVRYNWNKEPQDDYGKWDGVPRGVVFRENQIALRGGKEIGLAQPTEIPHLAAQYYYYVFPDDEARSVAFTNTFFNASHPEWTDPAVKVQALVKIGGAWGPVQDWTNQRGKAFCRDMKAERVQELLVVISNSSLDATHVLKPSQSPKLVATNIGCWRWAGTSTGTLTTKGVWTMTTKATVTFERIRYPAGSAGTLTSESYVPTGSFEWTLDGADSTCVYHGGPTTGPIVPLDGNLEINNYAIAAGRYYRTYSGTGGESQKLDYTITCGDTPRAGQWSGASWLLTNNVLVTVSDDGLTLDGEVVARDDAQFFEKSAWHLTAQREP